MCECEFDRLLIPSTSAKCLCLCVFITWVSMHLNYSAILLIWLVMFAGFVHSGHCVTRAIWNCPRNLRKYFENICCRCVVVWIQLMVTIHRWLSSPGLVTSIEQRPVQVLVSFEYFCWPFFRTPFANSVRIRTFYQSHCSIAIASVILMKGMMMMMTLIH